MKKSIILCYHKVGPEAEEGRWLNVEPTRLRSHVEFFKRRGYPFLLAHELAAQWPERSVCLTFDDAYVSALTYGTEVLKALGVRGTFYAVPSKVGRSSDWDGERQRPLADWELLRRAQVAGHEIGNHTLDHVRLAELDADEQLRQIYAAHAALTDQHIPSLSFCYPYGSLGNEEVVARAGYSLALALGKRVASELDSRTRLPRIIPSFSDNLALLLYKIYIRPKMP